MERANLQLGLVAMGRYPFENVEARKKPDSMSKTAPKAYFESVGLRLESSTMLQLTPASDLLYAGRTIIRLDCPGRPQDNMVGNFS